MKQYLIEVNGPTFACRVLVNAGDAVPMSVIENAVMQMVQQQQAGLAENSLPKAPLSSIPLAETWGRN